MIMLIKKYMDLSIKKKMITILVVCVLLPFFLIGSIVSQMFSRWGSEQNKEYEQYVLTQITNDFNTLNENASDFVMRNRSSANLQRIFYGYGKSIDYVDLYETFQNFLDYDEVCLSVHLIKDDRILFQIGREYIDDDIELAFEVEDGIKAYWSEAQTVDTYKMGESKIVDIITSVYNVYDLVNFRRIGQLAISYRKDDLIRRYINRFDDNLEWAAIVNQSGDIVLSSEKDKNFSSVFSDVYNQIASSTSSKMECYLPVKNGRDRFVLYYAKTNNNFMIVRIVPVIVNYQIIIYLFLVLFLCLLFGFTYTKVIQKSMINPLTQLSKQMKSIKLEQYKKLKIKTYDDEIGSIIGSFDRMMFKINDLINQVYIEKINTQEAEKNALISQMKPHFLYNTLDSMYWCAIRNKEYQSAVQLEALADIYRYVLNFGEEMVSLQDERNFLEKYFFLCKTRSSTPIDLIIDFEDGLQNERIPKLILQPLVENSIYHGLENKCSGGKIYVQARRRTIKGNQYLVIRVYDNGVGIDVDKLNKVIDDNNLKEGFALRSIKKRIALKCPCCNAFRFYSRVDHGTLVKIIIPFDRLKSL